MPARTIAMVVKIGKSRIRIPVPKIPMPLVEAKDKASAVQVKMASAVAIEFRRWQVQQSSLTTWQALRV